MLMSILKGQYDSFTGNEVTIFLKQQSFKGKWKDLFVFVERNDKMVWRYVPPRWLFPPQLEFGFSYDIVGDVPSLCYLIPHQIVALYALYMLIGLVMETMVQFYFIYLKVCCSKENLDYLHRMMWVYFTQWEVCSLSCPVTSFLTSFCLFLSCLSPFILSSLLFSSFCPSTFSLPQPKPFAHLDERSFVGILTLCCIAQSRYSPSHSQKDVEPMEIMHLNCFLLFSWWLVKCLLHLVHFP